MKLQSFRGGTILCAMNELDQAWSEVLANALEKAHSSGRNDIADYLRLRSTNDLVRQTAVDWLIGSFTNLAANESVRSPGLKIEREEPHDFPMRGANIVGTKLTIRQGVRCLTIEAGWTRTPGDGFMRGGSLAFARLRHFGIPGQDVDLGLNRSEDLPIWQFAVHEGFKGEFDLSDVHRHLEILLS